MNNKEEVLYSNDWFDIIKSVSPEGAMMMGIHTDDDNVVVLPYILEHDVITQIGVIDEHNPLRKNNIFSN